MELQHQEMEILIIRHLTGETSTEEEARLQEWLMESPENQHLFTQLTDTWMAADSLNNAASFDPESSWNAVQRRLKLTRKRTLLPRYGGVLRYAVAAALVVITLLGAFWIYRFSAIRNPSLVAIYASDSTRYVQLPDGSEVWLNRGTKISYPARFSQELRQVQLSGEAFFKVVHRDNQPFEVQTENSLVKVLGTSFDVKAFSGSANTSVLVETGRVRFSSSRIKSITMVLERGELGKIDHSSSTFQRSKSVDPNYLAWKTHRIRFSNNDLTEVAKVLQQVYGVNLQMENEAIKRLRFTAQYNEQEKLDDILETIGVSFHLKVEKTGPGQYLLRTMSR